MPTLPKVMNKLDPKTVSIYSLGVNLEFALLFFKEKSVKIDNSVHISVLWIKMIFFLAHVFLENAHFPSRLLKLKFSRAK